MRNVVHCKLGKLLDKIDGLLGVLLIDHLDGEARVHEHEIADARLRSQIERYITGYTEVAIWSSLSSVILAGIAKHITAFFQKRRDRIRCALAANSAPHYAYPCYKRNPTTACPKEMQPSLGGRSRLMATVNP